MMKNILGHHGLSQLVSEDTWSRTVSGAKSSSRIDHVYTNVSNRVTILKLVNNAYSDHEMFTLVNIKTQWHKAKIWRRNWQTYSKDGLLEELAKEDWNIMISNSQNFYNVLENKLIKR